MKKLLLLFCIILTVSTVSCSDNTEGYISVNEKKVTPKSIMTIGGSDISFEEYRYYYLNAKNGYDFGDEDYWNKNDDAVIKEDVLGYLKKSVAVSRLAEELDITADSKSKEKIDKIISEEKALYSDGLYEEELSSNYLNESLYRSLLEKTEIYNGLFDYYFRDPGNKAWSEEAWKKYFEDNYLRAQHIFINYIEGEGAFVYDKTAELIDEIYAKAVNGADFKALINEYGEDENMERQIDGYYFTSGDINDAVYNAAASLEIGGISKPVQTATGFYIIKRLPLEENGIESEKESALFGYYDSTDNFHSGAYDREFEKIIDDYASDLNIQYSEYYDSISHNTIF